MGQIHRFFGVILVLSFMMNSGCTEKDPTRSAPTRRAPARGLIFLQYQDPRFREGLKQHDFPAGTGYRLLNTGFLKHAFGEKWADSPALSKAISSGQPYYFDRICGGMPFQSLEGIKDIAERLKDDSLFLGFQVHEWGNSPIHDYRRIQQLILDKGLSFDRRNFAPFEGRIETPYFSAGDYNIYKDIYEPLHSLQDIERYLERYFKQIIQKTSGQVMSVTGYIQLHHTAFRLGAKNIMPEIGNQVPLTALQIAFARGAAREYNKPFGVYYEPWGGSPFGCACAIGFSPWFAGVKKLKNKMGEYHIGKAYGSSRSLQRRLLFYSWLAGATYLSEEWGAENYFGNWTGYPLTEYGRIVREFQTVSSQYTRPEPVVPAALIMPPGTFGVDNRYIAGQSDKLYMTAPPDRFHELLRAFAADVLAAQPRKDGGDAYNLTPSPWISSFDVLSAEAAPELLKQYRLLVYFDEDQAGKSPLPAGRTLIYKGTKGDAGHYKEMLNRLFPFQVTGHAGTAHAMADGRYLLGVFNNLGVTKTAAGERADPGATQTVTIRGRCKDVRVPVGNEFVTGLEPDKIVLNLPAGEITILSFPYAGE